MSLDVYLMDTRKFTCSCGIEHQVSTGKVLFDRNITHNVNVMAKAVNENFYKALWRPEELDPPGRYASDLLPYLKAGIEALKADPERYRVLNPENGWGSYDGLLKFAEVYADNCNWYPHASVEVSR